MTHLASSSVATPVLHLLAGLIGAGKSTYAERVLGSTTHLPFVHADVIAAEKWPGTTAEHAYEAAALAAAERERLITERRSFVAETVFSHPSKVDLVRDAVRQGYLVHLHVFVVTPDTSVGRVRFRVRRGGHDVPEQKIRQRHARLWQHIVEARAVADRTTVYDNSRADRPFRVIAQYERGLLAGGADWPEWTPVELRATE